jgi:polyisoprenoid-binding protein YceI
MRLDSKMLPVSLAAVLALAVALPVATHAKEAPSDPAALEGGTPVPDGAHKATFGFFGKQSITFTSDAQIERMVGLVSFDDAGAEPLGTATTDGKGGGSFSFKVPVAAMTTGSKDRDGHLRSDAWLDAARHPVITFTSTKVERVKPTVWRVSGTWSMHGVQKEISFLANVRHVGAIERVGDSVIRVRADFPVSLKAFGVTSPYVGSPAVAEAWDVSVDILGVLGTSK